MKRLCTYQKVGLFFSCNKVRSSCQGCAAAPRCRDVQTFFFFLNFLNLSPADCSAELFFSPKLFICFCFTILSKWVFSFWSTDGLLNLPASFLYSGQEKGMSGKGQKARWHLLAEVAPDPCCFCSSASIITERVCPFNKPFPGCSPCLHLIGQNCHLVASNMQIRLRVLT